MCSVLEQEKNGNHSEEEDHRPRKPKETPRLPIVGKNRKDKLKVKR